MITITIAKEFSDVPWGRFRTDGDFCGENFRDQILAGALKTNDRVVVDLDGVEGFGSSFLDEAFGGLVERHGFSPDELKAKLSVVTTQRHFKMYVDLIWRYIADAAKTKALVRA